MVTEVSPADVADRLDDPDAEVDLVDVREREDFDEAHVPGADNVPLDELEDAVDDREWGDEVVVSCYAGKTSVPAAKLVNAATDARAVSMAGGFAAWDGDVTGDAADAAAEGDEESPSPAAESVSD